MKVAWRKIGSKMTGFGDLGHEINKGKRLLIFGDNGLHTSTITDVLYDNKRNLCLVYTMNSIYEVVFE